MASALVIPCHLRTSWDLKCLLRLLDSVRDQSTPFSRVYVVDEGASERPARISQVRLGEHDGFFLINRRIKATLERPFLVRRDDEWGFCSTDQLRVGDRLIAAGANGTLDEEPIDAIERIAGRVRTVALLVPATNTYLADGAWAHNDASSGSASDSGLTISAFSSSSSSWSSSSGSKSSGSSFSSSGSPSLSIGQSSAGSGTNTLGESQGTGSLGNTAG
jgi:hypothetical protein